MKPTAIVSVTALLGLLALPAPGSAKTCEELLVGNTYSCTVVTSAFAKRADDGPDPDFASICAVFLANADPDRRIGADFLLEITGRLGQIPCTCVAKGKLKNPKFDESSAFSCLSQGATASEEVVAPAAVSASYLALTGKAASKGIKKGALFITPRSAGVFECTLDPDCVASQGCGLLGDTCGGTCDDGETCVYAGLNRCECVDAASTCEAADVCGDLPCPGARESCVDDVDGACACQEIRF